MKRAALAAMGFLVAIEAAMCGVLFAMQRSLLFHPVPASGNAPTLSLTTPAATLRIASQPHDGPRAILYFGGNAEDVSWTVHELKDAFPERAIYAPHYRGYGGSSGSPSEKALHTDAAAVFDLVAARHHDVDVIGRSLGSAVAVRLAATKPVRRLVLVTPFDSILALARRLFPFLPVRLLLADPFESVKDAPRITVPTLVIAAGADSVVPPPHTRRLLEAFRDGIATEVVFPHAGHDDVSIAPEYREAIRQFLERPVD
jgi:pimeloyl-ACP methyl ester carboxylesterase